MTIPRSHRIPATVAVVTIACLSLASARQSIPAPGTRTPGLALTVQIEGDDVRIETLRGKVVLIDFMTTVCPACKQASRGIQQVYSECGIQGFYPLAVALNVPSPDALRAYALEFGLTFPMGTAPRADVLTYLRYRSDQPFLVPTLVLLDRQGRVVSVDTGWKGATALRANVLKLLFEVESPGASR